MKFLIILLSFSLFSSCSTVYYNLWETLGKEKRDLLEMNMQSANEDQEDIEKEYKDSLDRIRKKYSFKEGELEQTYDRLSDDYEDIKNKQDDFSEKLKLISDIAYDLFDEWKKEARALDNKTYKRNSLRKLSSTKSSFSAVLANMKKVESRSSRILKKFHDQVIYIKHNLNAKIVGNLRTELNLLESEMTELIKEIQASRVQATKFISTLN